MNNYQLTILIKNDLEEKARLTLIDKLKTSFEKVTKEDLWGSKGLSYKIKHLDKAYYAHFEFEANPSSISSLDKNIKLNEDIIRYLLIRAD